MAAYVGITEWPGWQAPPDDYELPPVDADNRYEIWPENARVLALFGDMATQWMRDPNGTPTGIDYRALQAHLEWTVDDVALRRELYDDVRVMEQAASLVYAKQAAEELDAAKQNARKPS